jgi:hypothetical protein
LRCSYRIAPSDLHIRSRANLFPWAALIP